MKEGAGRGMRDAGRDVRDAGRGMRDAGPESSQSEGQPAFANVMRQQGMMAPETLARAIEIALAAEGATASDEVGAPNSNQSADTFLRAAERVLERVLSTECDSRDAALDLLTVDALMTRAMAIAAQDLDSLAKFPELAMKRIASK